MTFSPSTPRLPEVGQIPTKCNFINSNQFLV
ncbi:hypothetical protein VPHK449_0017 [Vibrio phage K449]